MCDVKENIQYDPQPPDSEDTCNSKATSTEEEEDSPNQTHENVTVNRELSKCNCKNVVTVICLWLTYLFISVNYSLIGPLFPSEVINLNII